VGAEQVDLLTAAGSRLGDLTGPADSRGFVVVGRCHTAVARPLLAEVVSALHYAGLGTLVVPMGAPDVPTMAGWIQAATDHLRAGPAGGRPIAFLGAGRGAAPGWMAAAASGGPDGVMAWNPRLTGVWSHLSHAAVPSLLVVDREAMWRLATARVAGWRLGGRADVLPHRSNRDLDFLASWFDHRLLAPPAPRPAPAAHRVRLASIATAAALAAGPLSATAAFAVPDFSAGGRLGAAQIDGDSARGRRAASAQVTTATTTPNVIKGTEIKGDGPRGDPPLTDGIGLRWNVNTNIGFTTTSSASGAVSEGNFTHAVAASTLNGGTVNQFLGDAFDGYNALCLDLNNVGGQCNTANMSVYNQNGPGALECSGRQVVLPQRTMGNFQVRRKVFVPSNDGFSRWLNIFRNTSASPQTLRMVTSNNLGSDANTRIVTTSDGDAVAELSDTWVTTFQNFSGTTSSDPRMGHVLRGLDGVVGLTVNNFVDGDDNPFWRYQYTLAPGQTAIIMNFATGQGTKAAAAAQAAALANLTNPNALACMTATEIGQVLNFKTDSTPPACIYQIVAANPKRVDFTVSDAGSGLSTVQITASQNIVLPVIIPAYTVGSTSPIAFSAVKDIQGQSAKIAVVITDVQGNQASCI
jgi:hypothetical protein